MADAKIQAAIPRSERIELIYDLFGATCVTYDGGIAVPHNLDSQVCQVVVRILYGGKPFQTNRNTKLATVLLEKFPDPGHRIWQFVTRPKGS